MDPGSHPGHLIQLGRHRPPAIHRILFLYDLPPFCQSEEIPISRFMPCFADFYFDTRRFPTRQRQRDDDPIKHQRERGREAEGVK